VEAKSSTIHDGNDDDDPKYARNGLKQLIINTAYQRPLLDRRNIVQARSSPVALCAYAMERIGT
jgi:hypothetical protein